MSTDKKQIEQLLANLPPRSLQGTLFNIAHAYALAAGASWKSISTTRNADFAAPAVMCQSFAVELLLKFFVAIDYPAARTVADLKRAGVKLKCHKYSELYDQLTLATKQKIARAYSVLAGEQTDAAGFREALVAQGDDPFVYWRYIYETGAYSSFDPVAFSLLTNALGKAAEVERKEAPQA